jgi:hypothetical protein
MSGKDIAKAFRAASRAAGDTARSAGHDVVVKRGRKIVSVAADGSETIVKSLDRAYVQSRKKTYKVT